MAIICQGQAVRDNSKSTSSTWLFKYFSHHLYALPLGDQQLLQSLCDDTELAFYRCLMVTARGLSCVRDTSLSEIISEIHEEPSSTLSSHRPSSETGSRLSSWSDGELERFVFKCVGWLTFLFEATIKTSNDCLDIEPPVSHRKQTVASNVFGRTHLDQAVAAELPAHQLLKRFGQQIIPISQGTLQTTKQRGRCGGTDVFSEWLIVSYLNFRTLHKVAGIQLEFVSLISMHLEFDEDTKRLKIFRFPSWCSSIVTAQASPPRTASTEDNGSDELNRDRPYLDRYLCPFPVLLAPFQNS